MIGTTEAAILARLSSRVAHGTVLVGTFADVDLTDDGPGPVVAQLRLERINTSTVVRGAAAQLQLIYSVSVYCDIHRSDETQKSAALQLLQDAGDAIVSWEYQPMTSPEIVDGPETVYDGRILRLGFAFAVHAYFSGS